MHFTINGLEVFIEGEVTPYVEVTRHTIHNPNCRKGVITDLNVYLLDNNTKEKLDITAFLPENIISQIEKDFMAEWEIMQENGYDSYFDG
jgi:hemerythrin